MNEETRVILSDAELLPRGDGSFILKPNKPVEWIRTARAAKMLGVSQQTIVRWWKSGHITGRRVGERIVQISVQSLSDYALK